MNDHITTAEARFIASTLNQPATNDPIREASDALRSLADQLDAERKCNGILAHDHHVALARIEKLSEEREAALTDAVSIMRAFACDNPPHYFIGVRHDPMGVHAWLAQHDAAIVERNPGPPTDPESVAIMARRSKRLDELVAKGLPDPRKPPDQPTPANPNDERCGKCKHKANPDGGWCYMFREQPAELCAQFKLTPAADPYAYDWSSAPAWAMWAATDQCGIFSWFEKRPSDGNIMWLAEGEIRENAAAGLPNPDWRSSLRQRPADAAKGTR